jgi:two-component system response regulator AtoC
MVMKEIFDLFFANSSKMAKIKTIIEKAAKTDVTILVRGETGTGKGLVAQTIHENSHRREKPFVKVNCAAVPRTLLESELFGFEKGAFTGAHLRKPGKFELANEGTLLLNDIGEMDVATQAKLLQVLQDGEFSHLGGNGNIRVNTRVITTTKDHLEKSMSEGRFREDLFFRINLITITVPPLRERKGQIPHLCQYFFNFYRTKYAKLISPLTPKALDIFHQYDWPGNMRELENIIKRIIILGREETALQELFEKNSNGNGPAHPAIPSGANNKLEIPVLSLKELGKKAAAEAEKRLICSTLEETHWNRKEAAKYLRVSYKALLYKIQNYHLDER